MSIATTAIRPEDHLGLVGLVANRLHGSAIARGADRDDLIGEAALGLVMAAPHFDPERGVRFSTFAVHAMTRAVVNALRRRRYHPLVGLPVDADGREIEREDHRAAEHATAEQAEDGARLDQWMRRLTPQERHVLELRFGLRDAQEHTLEQVGQVLGLTRERIRQVEARALRRLREAAGCEDPAPTGTAKAAVAGAR